ncbi:hypothetical protein [Fundicoccus culcitae]|uniref:Uncharacterized protein n=1 Tax=Fundicoccus culcitae TaxID=2969821 RepID=A0ABY5P4S9_9LACT|nr:hypothetical protein [Fundicoccus culcitae]UUX33711.1 hypothetical protein NRE15_12515 [Fundicoccus culcitae]
MPVVVFAGSPPNAIAGRRRQMSAGKLRVMAQKSAIAGRRFNRKAVKCNMPAFNGNRKPANGKMCYKSVKFRSLEYPSLSPHPNPTTSATIFI